MFQNLFKRLRKNKKGYSVGFTWIFGLVTIFGIGILYIVFSQVFNAHLVPVVKDMANNTAFGIPESTTIEINENIDKYMDYFNMMPYVLFLVVIIYMFVAAIRKEREENF